MKTIKRYGIIYKSTMIDGVDYIDFLHENGRFEAASTYSAAKMELDDAKDKCIELRDKYPNANITWRIWTPHTEATT